MAHGYMREFDDDRGENRDRWRDDDRERGWRGSDFRDRDRGFRGAERDWNERNRSFMLGNREERGGQRDRDSSRSDWDRDRRTFSSRQDDHYLSWRDRQMDALDRDYADYCREREQQFHQDFDSWRQQRQGNRQPLQPGMTQTSLSSDATDTLELNNPASPEAPDPTESARLGTTEGRGRR